MLLNLLKPRQNKIKLFCIWNSPCTRIRCVDIYNKIDEIGQYIQQAKVIPVINQKLLDSDYLMRVLEELYASIPSEIKQAKEITEKLKSNEERAKDEIDTMITKTKTDCERMLTEARAESMRMLDVHEIRTLAEAQAKHLETEVCEQLDQMKRMTFQEIEELRRQAIESAGILEEQSFQKAHEIRTNADQYAEDILNHLDSTVAQLQSAIRSGRKFFMERKEKELLNKSLRA